jgi:hypothetical protein
VRIPVVVVVGFASVVGVLRLFGLTSVYLDVVMSAT